ncbi:hypothetical protein ASB62_06400 [Chlorobium limicola]|uniref:Uncharacterized protein n=1 Tax=Chlorobium limicola TaxID=1092 RepID=A0A101JGY7_CHLLI|nr:hypothetical protein ASB62_06400 [Chlorobium limicola]
MNLNEYQIKTKNQIILLKLNTAYIYRFHDKTIFYIIKSIRLALRIQQPFIHKLQIIEVIHETPSLQLYLKNTYFSFRIVTKKFIDVFFR